MMICDIDLFTNKDDGFQTPTNQPTTVKVDENWYVGNKDVFSSQDDNDDDGEERSSTLFVFYPDHNHADNDSDGDWW